MRHGEVAGGSYYRGITDDPLTKLGWQQMQTAVANQSWDYIVSSPLQRCLQFATELSILNETSMSIDANWQEINFGDWEGKTAEQITQTSANALKHFYQDPLNFTPKNGEKMISFVARVNRAWQQLLSQHSGKNILVITHAGVIRCLFTLLLDLPEQKMFNLQIDHSSFTRFQNFNGHTENFNKLIYHNKLLTSF